MGPALRGQPKAAKVVEADMTEGIEELKAGMTGAIEGEMVGADTTGATEGLEVVEAQCGNRGGDSRGRHDGGN